MMDRKGDEILSTTSRFCPSRGPRAGLVIPFSIHHTKTGKPWNLFPLFHLLTPILLAFHLLVGYHFISKIIYVEGRNEPSTYIVFNIDVALHEHQLVTQHLHLQHH